MDSSTSPRDAQIGSPQRKMDRAFWRHKALRRSIVIMLWVIGLLTLAFASVLTRNHPGPWPVELAFSRSLQSLSSWPGLTPFLVFIGTFNNPTPTGILVGILFAGMILLGWYRQALFFALTVGIGNYLDTFIGNYVGRPRPSPSLIHVDVLLRYNSFPSGHVCHVVLFYGFLLFLSFTKPVRTWRYRWALIPLQIFAVLNILLMSISRVYEGEHWIFDTLGGYLSGALWLVLFIFLYQLTTSVVEKRRAKRAVMHSTPAYEA
jgi:membrane-associated phospholipid phosphatase